MKGARLFFVLVCLVHVGVAAYAQTPNPVPHPREPVKRAWEFSISGYGYLIPNDQSYGSATFAADHKRTHLEARYNYEDKRTVSLWAGYNFSVGERVQFSATPMVGGVFGNTNGVAPGCELSLTYRKVEFSSESEYLVDIGDHSRNFLYSWNELVYSPTEWLHAGLVSQRTHVYQTELDVQRGFSVGFAHKRTDFTIYTLNAGWTDPTVVLALTHSF